MANLIKDCITSIVQINAQHSVLASVTLANRLRNNPGMIALVQEPYTRGSKPLNIPKQHRSIVGTTIGRPRASIYVPKNSNIWALNAYCDKDTVLVACRPLECQSPIVWIASVYMDGEEDDLPSPMVKNIIRESRVKNIPLIIGCDANAHNEFWGSTNTNPRGAKLLEYLLTENLFISNIGDEPTFITRNRSEVLDITIVNKNASKLIDGWKVDVKHNSCSDHRAIIFHIKKQVGTNTKLYRPIRKTDWQIFEDLCENSFAKLRLPVQWNPNEIERLSTEVDKTINGAIDVACPLREPTNKQFSSFWNTELTKLRKLSRRRHRIAVRLNTTEMWDEYREVQRSYKKAVRQAKRASWRRYCEELSGSSAVAKIVKTLNKDTHSVLETLKVSDGTYTETPEETLTHLLDVHYPNNSSSLRLVQPRLYGQILGDGDRLKDMVTEAKVAFAIKSFGPYKSPGGDGVYPIMLQKAGTSLINLLTKIFRAIIRIGHIPNLWCKAKAIFLPKPGKANYNSAKSFRPITLMSFFLKSLERLVLIHFTSSLKSHNNQFAYCSNSNTEVALHHLVTRVEKSVYSKKMALSLFLDVEGAFSNVASGAILAALEERNLPIAFIRFVEFMLKNLTVTADHKGVERTIKLTRGCPQGGVLSPTLFTVIMDTLLKRFNDSPVYIQAYADDIVCIAHGFDVGTVKDLSQQALVTINTWCNSVGLRLSIHKTEAVLFTWKRNVANNLILNLNGNNITMRKQVKYLGIILDHKLSWIPECKSRARKAKMILAQCRRAIGKTYGLGSVQLKWIYTAMIRPILAYGALIWGADAVNRVTARTELERVQRLALVSMASAYPGTPTAALEVLFNIPPIEIFLKGEIALSMHRVISYGKWRPSYNYGTKAHPSHTTLANKLFSANQILSLPCDKMSQTYMFSNRFQGLIRGRAETIDNLYNNENPEAIHCFTDGSKNSMGTGSGIVMPDLINANTQHCSIPLGIYPTVFQAEVFAILRAAELLYEHEVINRDIVFHTDSQSAIRALTNPIVCSKTVSDCSQKLNRLGVNNNVLITWVPGHSDILGNELADLLAKSAIRTPFVGPQPSLPVSSRMCRTHVASWVTNMHQSKWTSTIGHKVSKKMMPHICTKRSRHILSLAKHKINQLTQVLTGHSELAKHRSRIKKRRSPICTKCNEEDETVEHYLKRCPFYEATRRKWFGRGCVDISRLADIGINKVVGFITETGRLLEHLPDDTVLTDNN